jgi:hypothetical protein
MVVSLSFARRPRRLVIWSSWQAAAMVLEVALIDVLPRPSAADLGLMVAL